MWALWAATFLGAVPLAWLTVRYAVGRLVTVPAWWIAAGFAVSTVTDLAVRRHLVPAFIASPVYLVSQGTLIAVALVPAALWPVLATLVACGIAALLFEAGTGPDVFLHTVMFASVLGLTRLVSTRFRWALAAYFGAGLLAWWAYCFDPSWSTWLAYQSCRLVGVILFCWASVE